MIIDKIKPLFQKLLNTRTTPQQASHYSSPSREEIIIPSNQLDYICPCDGYITSQLRADHVGATSSMILRNGLNVQGHPQHIEDPSVWTLANWISVSKGDTASVSYYSANVGYFSWRFIKSVGGGGFLENFSRRSFVYA